MKKILFWILILLMAFFTVEAADGIADLENQVKGVLRKISPSLVKVVAENDKKYVATGIAVDADYVLTSALITRSHYRKIYLETGKGETYPATLVGKDNQTGLTLLKLDKKVLTPVRATGKVGIGDWVALAGVFYNQFPSIYQGIVSSVSTEDLILNAPVAPGSAGGAVLNRNGELIGVIRGSFNFAFSPDYTFRDYSGELVVRNAKSGENLCYAVPSEKVMIISDALKKYGRIRRGWLGVKVDDGARVESVSPGAPAEIAGLEKGDEIRTVNGEMVRSAEDLVKSVRSLSPGARIKVSILRDGKNRILEAQVGELKSEDILDSGIRSHLPVSDFPPDLPPTGDAPEFIERDRHFPQVEKFIFQLTGSRQLGTDVVEMTPELAVKFKVKEGHGLMISRILERSAAQKAGLQVGDILVRANGDPIETIDHLRNVLRALQDKEAIRIDYYRDGLVKKIAVVPDKKEDRHWEEVDRVISRMKNWTVNEKDMQEKLALEKDRIKIELKKVEEDKDKMITEIKKNYEEQIEKLKKDIEKLKEIRKKEI